MDVTKSFRRLAIAIRDNVEEENRMAVYETMLEEFDEATFDINRLVDIDPYLDEVLRAMYPEEMVEIESEDEDEDSDPDGLSEVSFLDSSDESDDGYEHNDEDEEW